MASILNATTSSGLVTSADNSGSLQLATNNGTTALTISTAQVVTLANALPIASGGTGATSAGTALSNLGGLSGSSSQLAKAWVNWAGSSGTINSSYNVSSVTRNSTGNYTVNFTSAMPNTTYAITSSVNRNNGAADAGGVGYFSQATGSTGVYTYAPQGSFNDATSVSVSVFSS